MNESLHQVWQRIAARPSGPFALRFYLQPAIATIFAIRDGLRDAQAGRPAYFWSLLSDRENRRERVRAGWKSVGKVFIAAVILDIVYQLVVLHSIHPLETLLVATTLALVPYIIFRGPINRVVRKVR
jgi:hypothetical protein